MDNSVKSTKLSTADKDYRDCVLLVFAKQPVAGQVKTRLTPPLSEEQAATLYSFSQHQTIASLNSASFQQLICFSGAEDYFRQHYPNAALLEQGCGDLGQRLTRAFEHCRNAGWQRVCVIGTDSPDLPLNAIRSAFDCLLTSDFVTIPARDGGYVLAGSRCHCSPAFEAICWSTERVLEQTRQRLEMAGLSYQELDSWEDIDDIDAMRRFVKRSPNSRCGRYARRCLRMMADNDKS